MKIKIFFSIALCLCLKTARTQNQLEIFLNDNWTSYFKPLNKENGFHYNAENLKDSLADGDYTFYTCKRFHLRASPYSQITGRFVNGKKEGSFKSTTYSKVNNKMVISAIEVSEYKQGQKHGTYSLTNYENGIPISFRIVEFRNDKMDGPSFSWVNGLLEYAVLYSEGLIIQNYLSIDILPFKTNK